jgi:hypothetical protein
MNTQTGRRRALPFALLAVLCLAGCAAGTPDRQAASADRLADAGAICRNTMGLNAANAPYDLCVGSLTQNSVAPDHAVFAVSAATPESAAQKSCVRFGLAPDSKAIENCAVNLDASLFEAADVAAR